MRRIVSVIVCALLLGGGALRAQDDDDDQPFRPGLIATYHDQRAQPVVRIEPMVALDADAVPGDPRLPIGAQTVRWQGRFLTQGGGDYRLHVYAVGEVKIELAGKLVLAAQCDQPGWLSTDVLKLEHDYHPLAISYQGTPEAQRIRLFWSSDSFALEPLPAKQLVHEPLAPAESDFARGREL
ncbi:MAG TPA: hypothetical protein VL096_18860, partial [Pirellulaceae bacterium]|nr:hypothetical protein [Pirellulaceae bacterium]